MVSLYIHALSGQVDFYMWDQCGNDTITDIRNREFLCFLTYVY